MADNIVAGKYTFSGAGARWRVSA